MLAGVFSPVMHMGAETFAGVWHPVSREVVMGYSVMQLNIPFTSSHLENAGTSAAGSVQASDDVGVCPSSKAARRRLPGSAVSRELSFSSKP